MGMAAYSCGRRGPHSCVGPADVHLQYALLQVLYPFRGEMKEALRALVLPRSCTPAGTQERTGAVRLLIPQGRLLVRTCPALQNA